MMLLHKIEMLKERLVILDIHKDTSHQKWVILIFMKIH